MLVGLALGALLPTWILSGYAAWRWAGSEREARLSDAREAARGASVLIGRELAGLRAGLAAAAAVLARTGDPTLLDAVATSFAPSGGRLSLHAAGSEPALRARAEAEGAAELVRAALDAQPGEALLSGPLPGREDAQAAVGLALRADLGTGEDGAPVRRVLLLTFDPSMAWSRALDRDGHDPNWIVALADAEGAVLASNRPGAALVGRSLKPGPLDVLRVGLLSGAEGGESTVRAGPGDEFRIVWRRLPGESWTVLVGVPAADLEGAGWRTVPLVGTAGLALVLGFSLFLAWWVTRRIVRPLAALTRGAVALGQGARPGPVPASGLRELDHAARALAAAGEERERQERRLRDLGDMLGGVLDHIPVGVVVAAAPSGRVVLCSARVEEILGRPLHLSPSPADYAADWRLLRPDGAPLPSAEHPLALTLSTGEPAQAVARGGADGRWLRISAAPIRDARGRLASVVAAIADVDGERRSEAALRAGELRFRALAEATPLIVLSALPDGAVEYVNPRFEALTGLPPAALEAAGAPALHPADRRRVLRSWRRAVRRGGPASLEFRLRRAEGGWRWMMADLLPARAPDGAVQRLIGAASDVTDLVETREALARQVTAEAAARGAATEAAASLAAAEERFRRFAEASPDVLWLADAEELSLDYVSPATEAVWGISAPRLLSDPGLLRERVHPEDREGARRALEEGARTEEPFTWEYRVRHPDGGLRWIRETGFAVRARPGERRRVGGLARDITGPKSAEARQALLLAELNHRVKNTLTTIQSLMVQTARTAAGAPEPLSRFTADFQGRLLALSRAHELLTASTWEGATLGQALSLALAPWGGAPAATAGTGARVTWEGPEVWLLPRQALGLSMALHELATNAARHGALSPAGGRVLVAWSASEAAGGMLAVSLDWRESGGPEVHPPARRGFGSRLLERGLTVELGAGSAIALDYSPPGFHAHLAFSAPGRPAPRRGAEREEVS